MELVRRRQFIALIGGAVAAWPLALRAQQTAMPVVGYLAAGSPNKPFIDAFHQGLKESGFIESQNVAFEYRFANGQHDQLPALAADLVGLGVTAIFTEGGRPSALAAKKATATIPIVFLGGGDPVHDGLVSSMNRPDANLTGVSLFSAALGPKKLELLRELVPRSGVFGVLMDRTAAGEIEVDNVSAAAKAMKQETYIVGAGSVDDIEHAFEVFADQKVAAVLVTTGADFGTNTQRIVALAARYSLPAIYDRREFAAVGGLVSYGTRFTDVFRQAGAYVARMLKGAKPADLPVLQPTTFELVINLKTARTLGLAVPQSLLVTADEVIE